MYIFYGVLGYVPAARRLTDQRNQGITTIPAAIELCYPHERVILYSWLTECGKGVGNRLYAAPFDLVT